MGRQLETRTNPFPHHQPQASINTTIEPKTTHTMASSDSVTIESLPPELLFEILGCLDSPPPSETQLHDQPHTSLLSSPEGSLKNASLVCRTWRAIALPILFRHVVWDLDQWELFRVDPIHNRSGDPIEALPILAFLRDNCLARHVDSLAMVVRDSLQGMVAGGLVNTSRSRAEDGEDAGSDDGSLAEHPRQSRLPRFARQQLRSNQDCNWLWDTLFEFMNPRKITLLASPQVLATLLSTRIYLNDAWSFSRTPIHALSLSRETRSKDEVRPTGTSSSDGKAGEAPNEILGTVSSEVLQRPPTKLFTIRPWTHLLLNEGSSTRVYKTYEFFHRRPPSILGSLLGANRKNPPLVPPTLKSLAYVAVFPLSTHFTTLVDNLPRLDRLFVQIVPRDNFLQDPDEMRHVQPSDLWMERNSCYSLVMRELLSHDVTGNDGFSDDDADSSAENGKESNWLHLQEFESGDAADKEAWDMAVQFVCMSGTDWHVEREGVLVKHPTPAGQGGRSYHEPVLDSDDSDDSEDEVDGAGLFAAGMSVFPDSFSPW